MVERLRGRAGVEQRKRRLYAEPLKTTEPKPVDADEYPIAWSDHAYRT